MERLCLTSALDGAYSTISKIRIRRTIRQQHSGLFRFHTALCAPEVRDDAMLVFRIVMLEGV